MLNYIKEEFRVIKEHESGNKISAGGFALSDVSCYA